MDDWHLFYHGQVPDKGEEVVLHGLVPDHTPEVFVWECVWHGVVHADLVPDGGKVDLLCKLRLLQDADVGYGDAAYDVCEHGCW